MCCFVLYVVIGLRSSVLVPRNATFPPLIDFYVYLSMAYTLISVIWFVVNNYWRNRGAMPKCLQKLSEISGRYCAQRRTSDSSELVSKSDHNALFMFESVKGDSGKEKQTQNGNASSEYKIVYLNLVDVFNRWVAFLFLLLVVGTQVAFWIYLAPKN